MKIIILILVSLANINNAHSDIFKFNNSKKEKVSIINKEKHQMKKLVSHSVNSKKSSLMKANEVNAINTEADKKNAIAVQAFLKSRNMGITDNTNTFDVLSGSTLKGIILNSIVSSNMESPILVQITESNCDIPVGFKLLCGGSTRGKRVVAGCSKLITNSDEFLINAILLNVDGTAGLTGEVFTGKEELVLGALVGGGLSAALDVSRDRVSTATGELATNSQRNKIITGAMGGLDEAVGIMGDDAKNKETKISIEAGSEVLIFINQRFKI